MIVRPESTIAETLAHYAVATQPVPDDVLADARMLLADTLGVTLLGATMPWSQAIRRVAEGLGGASQSTICPDGVRTSAPMAAFVNGSFAHANDFDDYYAFGPLHPSAGVWAVLPVAEWCGASGDAALRAIALYYDTCTRLAEVFFQAKSGERSLASRGFQAQALCGVFAAALTTCNLLRMDVPQTVNALGIAGSYPGGILEFLSDSSDTKRFHFGKASAQGIMAALLAREGFRGPSTVFEGQRGFFNAYAGDYVGDQAVLELGQRYDIRSSVKKRWPVMGGNTAPVEGLLEIVARHGLNADDIETVTFGVRSHFVAYAGSGAEGASRNRPRNRFEAEMSLPYQAALAVVRGGITLDDFDEASLCDPEILAFADKVQVLADPEIDQVSRRDAFTASRVTVHTHKSHAISERHDLPLGDPRRPMSEAQLLDKFLDCASRAIPLAQGRALWERCMTVGQDSSLDQLIRLSTVPPRTISEAGP